MAQVTYIVCPLCAYNYPLEKKGTNALTQGKPLKGIKGRFRFDKVNIDSDNNIFEDIREGGGKGSGYVRTKTRSLKEILRNKDLGYQDLIKQLYNQSKTLIKLIESYPDYYAKLLV